MSTPAGATTRPLRVAGAASGRLHGWGAWLGAALVVLLLPHVIRTPVAVPVMNQMGIAIVFALSYNVLLGQGGMLSFGHAVYFGLGGFIAAHALNQAGHGAWWLPLPFVPLVGALGGLVSAALFGLFSTIRAGTVFAMISLGIAELMAASSLIFNKFFGGEEGITANRTKAPLLFGLEFTTDRQVYYLIAVWALVAIALMYAFSRTPVGRMANAVRDNPERAEFVGYSARWVRYVTFCAAGFFAGVGGGLFAANYEILTAENMGLNASGAVLLMTYIGGIGYFVGPVVGAIVFTFLQSMLSDYTDVWLLYLGIVFLATVLFVPMGLTGIFVMHGPAWRARRLGRVAGPYVITALAIVVAAVGVIGLVEMLHVLVSAPPSRSTKRLFWALVNVRTPAPWLVFAAVAAAGVLGLRRTLPRAGAAFADASRPEAAR